MAHVPSINTQIISNLNSHLASFKYSDSELNALALGILEGLKLANVEAPLLALAVTSDNIKRLLAGELSD
jgi:hypothetical protein